ncbi:FkbM family methyltransferase [Mycobacterium sp. M23085]|uniref:FkbM family methyltransferase n=1 Tax=Mycobacterium sp. M23085 TaxID=3378087 RepID=UPI003877E14B
MAVAGSVKRRLAPAARKLAPRRFWRRKFRILQRLGQSRPDIQLVASLCDPHRISVDVGADLGEFTIAMLASSRSVIAVEPRPAQARNLASMFEAVGAAVQVAAVALSDEPGTMTMRVVAAEPGRSTIEAGNALGDVNDGEIESIDVPVRRLDDLRLADVGLIKIDVEGHEIAVLHGATETLTRHRPAIVVEAEERHHANAVTEITGLLNGLGYAGYFDLGGVRRPIAEFDPARHQDPANVGSPQDGWAGRGVYVNNFIFLPENA